MANTYKIDANDKIGRSKSLELASASDDYETLQTNRKNEVNKTSDHENNSFHEVKNTHRKFISRRKVMICAVRILVNVVIIATLIAVVINLTTTSEKDIDECSSGPYGSGICIDGANNYKCLCRDGFDGTNCEYNIDECSSSPCGNGTCIDGINKYTCLCADGIYGTNCEHDIDECSSSPCGSGICIDVTNNYKCLCHDGFNGRNCEHNIYECSSSPCGSGICIDGINKYTCLCADGIKGTNCEHDIDECSSSPCGSGICIDGTNNYKCLCHDGFNGTNCEHNINECSSSPCGNGTCIDGVNKYTCLCDDGINGTNCEHGLSDCLEILRYDNSSAGGVYAITTWRNHRLINVYCDMSTDGGGWTVFQNRFDGSVDFYRNFSEYEAGFGDLNTEFWLGLSNIQELASQGQTCLRIDLEAANGTKAYEMFESFYLAPGPAYTLHLGPTIASSGTSPDVAYSTQESHNGARFSTYDHDADTSLSTNKAVTFHGGWWYKRTITMNLNGLYLTPGTTNGRGMIYNAFVLVKSLKSSKMMIRRN